MIVCLFAVNIVDDDTHETSDKQKLRPSFNSGRIDCIHSRPVDSSKLQLLDNMLTCQEGLHLETLTLESNENLGNCGLH